MDLDTYRQLRSQAARLTRKEADAGDLVQDVLVIALQAGRSDLPWLAGVLQRQAAMTVRTAARRRRREAVVGIDDDKPDDVAQQAGIIHDVSDANPLLQRLSPAGRRVAVLALHGLDADEIRWILSLSSTAFRQRLTSIRKALGALPEPLRAEALALAYVRDPARCVDLQFGLVRRALKAALRITGVLAPEAADNPAGGAHGA